ncbi:MAG: hypothetical protein IJZ88_03360 [Clostridia bacterium]|nr:hypothetical protein [Clostridia bacterium]
MIFLFKYWDIFCEKLDKCGVKSIPACEVKADEKNYLVLKHDVETNVANAHRIAVIENKYGHRGSYYVQAYLLEKDENVKLLTEMKNMGHEISYHYDVLDSCKGNFDSAIKEFEKNRCLFETNGFSVVTVCQHGNPVIERNGYHSNRDFFRSERVRELYPDITDIMVNFKEQISTDYLYFSDAGRRFNLIYDPINNDIIKSDDKNIPFENLQSLTGGLSHEIGNIISIHPHRWMNSALKFVVKSFVFKILKAVAKTLEKVPVLNRIMSKYYYLAKKI